MQNQLVKTGWLNGLSIVSFLIRCRRRKTIWDLWIAWYELVLQSMFKARHERQSFVANSLVDCARLCDTIARKLSSEVVLVAKDTTKQSAASHLGRGDDARWYERPMIGDPQRTLQGTAYHAFRSVALLVALVIWPLSYLSQLLKRRRWSLRFFLLSPLVVLAAVTAWKLFHVSDPKMWLDAFLTGVCYLIAGFGFWHFGTNYRWARWLLPLIVLFCGLCWVGFFVMENGVPNTVQYIVGPTEFLAALLQSAVAIGGLFGWVAMIRRVIPRYRKPKFSAEVAA